MGVFSRFVQVVNSINSQLYAMALVAIGVTLDLKGHHLGESLWAVGLTIFRVGGATQVGHVDVAKGAIEVKA